MSQITAYDLEIQKFLRRFESVGIGNHELLKRYKLNVTFEDIELGPDKIERLWLYNYDPIKSKGFVKIENEARSLILDRDGNVVSMSFPRFFNYHENNAAKIDWDYARAEMKYDGSLVVIYPFRGKHYIQTRRKILADGPVGSKTDTTFADIVIEILRTKFGNNPFQPFEVHNRSEKYCFVFELIGPDNRIVTPYDNNDLILLTAFNKNLGIEVIKRYVDAFALATKFRRPATMEVSSIDEAYKLLDSLEDLAEGLVIADYKNRRIKLKKRSYIEVSKMVNAGNQISARNIANIVLAGDTEEVISYFNHFQEILTMFQTTLQGMLNSIEDGWAFNKDSETRKEFASRITSHPLKHILFQTWDGKIKTVDDILPLIKPESLVEETKRRYGQLFNSALDKLNCII